jgi:DNA polymerase-3 subunit alpha
LEKALRFGNQYQQQKASSQHSLFGEEVMVAAVADPEIPMGEPWTRSEMLDKELEVTGMYISGHPLDDYRLELSQLCKPVSDIEQFVGKDIRVGGMVKSIQHRSTKTGKGFGLFALEDFSGSYGLALFGESYINFKNYLEDGLPVLVSGRYQSRYARNPAEEQRMEFQVTHIELLSSAREKYALGIELILPASEVDDPLIDAIEALLKSNPGNHQVKMVLLDRQDKLSIAFNCRKYLINLSNEFVKAIERLQVNYKLIPKRT